MDRRRFFRKGWADLVRGVTEAVEQVSSQTGRRLSGGKAYLRPPGAQPEAAFLLACTRCNKCAEVCEPKAIRFLGPEAGAAVGTPYIDPMLSACTLCLECTRVCPEGALQPVADPRQVRMGTAVINPGYCWAHQGQVCDICYQHCPYPDEAIYLEKGLPVVAEDLCTGCGKCAYVCPGSPPAIRIAPRGEE